MTEPTAPASSHKPPQSAKQLARFQNLGAAGKLLSEKLRDQDMSDALVLGIACAGVPVAREVATQLGLPLDVLLLKRLFVPGGLGSTIGAASVAGTMVLDEGIDLPADPSTPRDHFILDAVNQFRERENVCRSGRAPLTIDDRRVLLVDCAIHTGETMKIALRAVRNLGPAQIIVAVPVASGDGSALIDGDADEFVCLAQPEPFGHSALWYKNFDRPKDEDVPKFFDAA